MSGSPNVSFKAQSPLHIPYYVLGVHAQLDTEQIIFREFALGHDLPNLHNNCRYESDPLLGYVPERKLIARDKLDEKRKI